MTCITLTLYVKIWFFFHALNEESKAFVHNGSLKNKKGNFAMTDPPWIVQKADKFDACSNRHGAIPFKTLVVFFTRIAKQAVLIHML